VIPNKYSDFTAQSNDNDIVTLAVISTRINSHQSDGFIDKQQSIWSRNIQITLAKPFVSLDQVIAMSDEGWTMHSLTNGSILASISTNNIRPTLDNYCLHCFHYYFNRIACYRLDFVLYEFSTFNSYTILDFTRVESVANFEMIAILKQFNMASTRVVPVDETKAYQQ
jgi:hypothetical protein